jgi:outer membrane protein assembly factor BamB
MKNFILVFVVLMLPSCSFDNKTGLWKDASNIPVDNQIVKSINLQNQQNMYQDVFTKKQSFNDEVDAISNSFLKIDTPITVNNWFEEYGTKTNNVSNFSYDGTNTLLSKSSKLKNLSSGDNILFYNNNLIASDQSGKIFIYSLSLNKKIFEYNFYQKKFKNFKKKIYFTIHNNSLYAADNLGYIYAIDLAKNSLIWAKNYGIPFRSNLKIIEEQIFLVNQDNVIYSIDAITGEKKWQFSSNPTFLKSEFKNNIAIDVFNKNLFFLNTSGEFYSINYLTQKINWVLNLKSSSLVESSELFLSQPIVFINDSLIVSTERSILNYNTLDGSRNWSFPSNTVLKPVLTTNYTYILSNNDLLICIENKTGKVFWSQNIYKNLEIKKKKIGKIYDFKIINNEISIFSKKGYYLTFNSSNGLLQKTKKISKNGINSKIVLLNEHMFLIDNLNKLLKFN